MSEFHSDSFVFFGASGDMLGVPIEMLARQEARSDEMDAYKPVLHDAMSGDATLFAREDYVEVVWRIVDPLLKPNTPMNEYEPGTWGPAQVEEKILPPDGWHNQVMATPSEIGREVGAA